MSFTPGPSSISLRPAVPADRADVASLLAAVGLPLAGLGRDFPAGYVVARSDAGALLGCAGVEQHGRDGLLRSVAVAGDARGLGLGRRLVADRRAWASARGLAALYLLTTDAAPFFAGLGFRVVARDEVGAAIRASEEFAAICPGSATCMTL